MSMGETTDIGYVFQQREKRIDERITHRLQELKGEQLHCIFYNCTKSLYPSCLCSFTVVMPSLVGEAKSKAMLEVKQLEVCSQYVWFARNF